MAQINDNLRKEKFLIIDGNGLAYRSFYAVPVYKSFLGMPVNAICGFVKLLLNVIYSEAPTHIAVAFDHGAFTEHLLKYQGYNVQREPMPEELSVQISIIEDFVHACGFKTFRMPGFEADDCIGTIARQVSEAGMRIVILSGDLELLQLVSSNVSVLTTQRGIGDTKIYNEEAVKSLFRLAPKQLADLRALAGDSGQNIGGIPGIGNVTASRLLSQYDNLENLYENLDRLPAKWRNPLREHYDMAMEFLKRATIRTDLPLEFDIKQCRFQGIPVKMFSRVFELLGGIEFGLGTALIEKFRSLASEELPSRLPERPLSAEEAVEVLKECANDSDDISFVWLVKNRRKRGLAVANTKKVFYMHCGNGEGEISSAKVRDLVQPIFDDEKRTKYVYRGLDLPRSDEMCGKNVVNVALASALLNPELWDHRLEAICARFSLVTYDSNLLFGFDDIDWKDIPERNKMCWASCAAHVVSILGPMMVEKMKARGVWELYKNVDTPFAACIRRFIMVGVKFDMNAIKDAEHIITDQMAKLRANIDKIAGFELNIEDDKALGEYLFNQLGLLVPTRPKLGEPIDTAVLAALEGQHEVVNEIRKYRELVDFIDCFEHKFVIDRHLEIDISESLFNVSLISERTLQSLNKVAMIGPGSVAHRISAIMGNILSLDMRVPLRKAVRRSLIPYSSNHTLVVFGFDQPWLRVLAHLAKDEVLQRALDEGNVEKELGSVIFDCPAEELLNYQLRTIRLMITRSMSKVWMARRLNLTEDEANAKLELFDSELKRRFPVSWAYMCSQLEKAMAMEELSTLAGRKRLIIEALSRTYDVREHAERQAMAYSIEGSFADIIRLFVSNLYREFGDDIMVLPLFEGIVFDIDASDVDKTIERVCKLSELSTYGVKIPFIWKTGENLDVAIQGVI